MTEQKDKGLSDQLAAWFLNRGLFSDHFLKARLPQRKEWQSDGQLADFHHQLLSLYGQKKNILSQLNEAQTEKEFVQPVLDLLGHADSYIVQAPTKVGKKTNRPDYALFPDQATQNKAYAKLKKNDYTLCIGIADAKHWERELDLAKASDRDTFTNQNPSFQIANYLTGTKQTWGLLTNGRLWRLYCAKSHLPLGNYYQVDIVQLLDSPEEALKYFYLFFRKAALIQVDGKSFLDHVLEESNQYAVELEADIKERAYDVVEVLCRGFAAGFSPDQLTEQTLKTIYDNSLTLLYRLLFVFYAEARELLPLTTNQSYRDKYSSHKLTQEINVTLAKGYHLSSQSTNYYQYINSLSKLINKGDQDLGVPEYNGGLFDAEEHPFLEEHAIADSFLVQAIHQLARIPDKKLGYEVAVDYNTLSERHLGSIYEGLLEFKPRIAASDLVAIKDKGIIRYAPADKYPDKKIAYKKDELYLANDKGERKASGSYYTPEYIVNYIVENTLDPLVKEANEKVKALKLEVDKAVAKWKKLEKQKQDLEPTEKYDRKIAKEQERLLEPYLSLKVLDPAMGSGHFLARATDFLAEAIATDPYIRPPLELAEESELTYYRRRVVESCIHGVDLNPLAVELAKLTLWLGTMAKSKPLSFLNHHLRVGNSLIGARVADLDEIPKAKERKGKSIDLSRAPVQLGLFQEAFAKRLYDLLQNRALIAQLPTETLEDVHKKEKWERDFEHNIRRFRALGDLWVSAYFGNNVAWDEYNTLVENLQSPEPDWEKVLQKESVQKAIAMREEKCFFHWELEFPEVFYDEKGSRKANPGFDSVIGNPPYGSALGNLEKNFCRGSFSCATKLFDNYLLFTEKGLMLIRDGGRLSFIMPSGWLTAVDYQRFRQTILANSLPNVVVHLPYDVFPDAYIDTIVVGFVRIPGDARTHANHEVMVKRFGIREDASALGSAPVQYESVPLSLWIREELMRFDTKIVRPFAKVKEKLNTNSVKLGDLVDIDRGITPYRTVPESHVSAAPGFEGEFERYLVSSEIGVWVQYDRSLMEYTPPRFSAGLRLVVRRIISRGFRLLSVIESAKLVFNKSYLICVAKQQLYSLPFICSLVNSRVLSKWFAELTEIAYRDDFPQIDIFTLKNMPIHRINFTTPENERKQLLEKSKELYQEYLESHDRSKVLGLVGECLPQKADGTQDAEHEKSDVVHDLLAFLAGEMTQLNKEKQSVVKGFLTWLEKEILKGSVEDQKNKTKIKDFHNNTFEDLEDVLKKNKVVPDPCPSNIRDTIANEFSTAVNTLTPLKTRIKATDDLIDRIVYRLYGLTDAEIAVVEGQQSSSKSA